MVLNASKYPSPSGGGTPSTDSLDTVDTTTRAVSKIVCHFWEHQKMSNLEKLMYIFFLYMHGVENLRLYEVSHTGPGETKGKTRNVAKMWLYEFLWYATFLPRILHQS